MKAIGYILVVCLLAGCSVANEQSYFSTQEDEQLTQEMMLWFVSLRQIHEGMTRKEVRSVLGDKLLVGYELFRTETAQYRPITFENPYRTEKIFKGKKDYVVDYYLVGLKAQDDHVADDELVPLVFYKNRLKGRGWEYLKKIKN